MARLDSGLAAWSARQEEGWMVLVAWERAQAQVPPALRILPEGRLQAPGSAVRRAVWAPR
jgi:hypothetical protein